jgi:hypothetical protein
MQVHHLDPAFTTVERDRANFRLAIRIAVGFVALLWLIQLSNWVLGLGPADLGVRPRELSGLLGVIFAPLLHGGPEHLLANTPPLLVAGTTMLYLYPRSSPSALAAVYFGFGDCGVGAGPLVDASRSEWPGLRTCQLHPRRRPAKTRPASDRGVAAGVLHVRRPGLGTPSDRERGLLGNASRRGVIGAAMAIKLRRFDIPPRRRYTWEDEDEAAEEEGQVPAGEGQVPPHPLG